MFAVKAIFDGNNFKLEEPLPTRENYEVIITFTKPIERSQEDILQYFNTWDKDDADCISEIIKERDSFSMGRTEI